MRRTAFVVPFAVALIAGCGSDPKPPPETAPAEPAPTSAAPAPKPPRDADAGVPDTYSNINISDEIRKACGTIPEARFDFDSADVTSQAAAALNALATCFITGPLKGRKIKLVGHTDPRGVTDYNFGLGQLRADSVGKYLMGKGMQKDKVASSSQGELQATGSDESGWAKDRRVDVMLGD